MISRYHVVFFISLNSHTNSWLWIHIWFHDYEFIDMNSQFTIFLMIMNSYMNSYFVIMNSHTTFQDLWIQIWIHVYEENIVKSYLKWCVPRFQMYDKSITYLMLVAWHYSHCFAAGVMRCCRLIFSEICGAAWTAHTCIANNHKRLKWLKSSVAGLEDQTEWMKR